MRLTLLLPTFTIGGIIDIQRKPYIEDKQKILEPLVKDSDFGTVEYDHEVMLGENWQDYEDLPRPIAKHRFSLIYDKIDRNKDDLVTREELRNWIKYVNNTQWASGGKTPLGQGGGVMTNNKHSHTFTIILITL